MNDVNSKSPLFEDKKITNDSSSVDGVNRMVRETVVRKAVPVQRDLSGHIIAGQKSFYEEVSREVTYRATHHKLNEQNLSHFIYPTNFEVREYQFDIVRKSLYQNILCAIPTGMGKTFIASTVMLNFFNWTTEGKIIFTAPTRPLVAQQIKACLGITGIPHDETAILLDKSRKNREQIWDEKRVFFTTPQVVENDLKRGVLNPKSIVCLVIDEAHRATGSYAYTNIVKFVSRFNTSYRILALTATPGANLEVVQDVVNNLEICRIEARTEESMDIVRYMKKRHQKKIQVDLSTEIEDIIEKLGIAIAPILQQAIELGIYEDCKPYQINAFKAMQQSQKIVANPSIPEGIKWRNFFILQLLNHVGQMLKRIKIYGIRTFYTYFSDKHREFTVKYTLGKSTNKTAAEFYYHPIIKNLLSQCEDALKSTNFISHGKLQHMKEELNEFFSGKDIDSRVIIFTELRESALEIVKFIDSFSHPDIKPHIFIGQAKGKEGFDEVSFTRKNNPKGRKKADRLKRQEEEKAIDEERKAKKKRECIERTASRTGSSEEAQLNGMTQKQQKQVIQDFKNGLYTVLVCTSIGEEGLDIGEVDMIICYDTTGSPIKNIQRMGRTGRKRDGQIVLLFSGNESLKFDQAMKEYYNLQKLICQNYLQYRKSDRIIPKDIEPICRKEFITVSEEDREVNEMEDADEVIRYATQCMLGKKTTRKSKTRKREHSKKKEKQFFMPDNVTTGIVTAANLVKKVETGKTFEKQSMKEFPALDSLHYDSMEYSSPSKSEFGDAEAKPRLAESLSIGLQDPRDLRDLLFKENTKMEPISPEKSASAVAENLSLGQKIDDDELRRSSPIAKRRKIKLQHTGAETHSSVPSSDGMNLVGPRYSNDSKITCNGFLKPHEREFFLKNYSAHHTVSIDTIPTYQKHTQTVTIPHSSRNLAILKMFQAIKEGSKAKLIEMNRNKCIARGLQSGALSFQDKEVAVIVNNDSIAYTMPRSQGTERSSMTSVNLSPVNLEELDEILGSDSDF